GHLHTYTSPWSSSTLSLHDALPISIAPSTGPEENAAVEVACAFVTNRGSWTSSSNTRLAGRSLTWSDSAVSAAALTFAGPSAPGRVGLRMAPVAAMWTSESLSSQRPNADSSRVSVP